ncbi:MAG TPA: sulfotransferase, partial [Pirellulaceae bacterium]|nr:sulfotransferase [Pirellulaceae bacterium]
ATDQQLSEHSPYQVDQRQIVIVASTMRSGSTLLKALMATAPDISDLPEVNFQRLVDPNLTPRVWALAAQRIVLLKRPAWYHEIRTYPRIPESLNPKLIVLVRDAWETVRSIRRMTFGILGALVPRAFDRWLLLNYWLPITERLVRLADDQPDCAKLVRYEDLVADPRQVTSQLFEFVGSRRHEGVDAYQFPKRGPWRWWSDDNSLHLQSLRVQKSRDETRPPVFFEQLLTTESRVVALRSRLGYSETSS